MEPPTTGPLSHSTGGGFRAQPPTFRLQGGCAGAHHRSGTQPAEHSVTHKLARTDRPPWVATPATTTRWMGERSTTRRTRGIFTIAAPRPAPARQPYDIPPTRSGPRQAQRLSTRVQPARVQLQRVRRCPTWGEAGRRGVPPPVPTPRSWRTGRAREQPKGCPRYVPCRHAHRGGRRGEEVPAWRRYRVTEESAQAGRSPTPHGERDNRPLEGCTGRSSTPHGERDIRAAPRCTAQHRLLRSVPRPHSRRPCELALAPRFPILTPAVHPAHSRGAAGTNRGMRPQRTQGLGWDPVRPRSRPSAATHQPDS